MPVSCSTVSSRLHTCQLALLVDHFRHPAALDTIRVIHVATAFKNRSRSSAGNLLEQAPVRGNSLEQRRDLGERLPVHRISVTAHSLTEPDRTIPDHLIPIPDTLLDSSRLGGKTV
jgi:hypothetical protein